MLQVCAVLWCGVLLRLQASALCSAGSQVHRQVNKLVGNRVVCPLDDLLIQIQACGLADMFDISSEVGLKG